MKNDYFIDKIESLVLLNSWKISLIYMNKETFCEIRTRKPKFLNGNYSDRLLFHCPPYTKSPVLQGEYPQ